MRILFIEDDPDLCEVVSYSLQKEGHTVDVCHEGDDGLRWMRQRAHDIVLLDRMLPCMDGITLLKKARKEGVVTPVLMVTALGGLEDLVEGLDHGADDYIVKPFATAELLARIRAMGRRPRRWETGETLRCGELVFDITGRTLSHGSLSCSLSKRESALLEILMKNAGKTLPRGVLLGHVWGPDAPVEEGNLENYIHFLRRRLGSVNSPFALTTVRTVGYILEEKRV